MIPRSIVCKLIRHNAYQKLSFSQIPQPRKGFLNDLIDTIRDEFSKNKELKENLNKFREEAKRLENSDALQQVRQKYQKLEQETMSSSSQLKNHLETLRDKIQEGIDEAQKSEFTKKALELSEEIAKQAKGAAETASKAGKSIGSTEAYKAISESVRYIKEELEQQTAYHNMYYRPLEKLRKRSEYATHINNFSDFAATKTYDPNSETTDVVMHKDSKWYQGWQNWKDSNPYINKIFDLKTKYDESDSVLIRASRFVTDTVSDIIGGMFTKTELSEVLTEITKLDPTFDKLQFLEQCRRDIVPNILEALLRGELDILKDWCHEAPYNILSQPIIQAKTLGYVFDSRLIDISPIELTSGKILEQGPVLVLNFHTQQIMCIRDEKGNVVEGSPDKIMKMQYIWILCRDTNEHDPKASWKLLDLSIQAYNQWT